jgi:tetratricopeptide (TPR) repeat protein
VLPLTALRHARHPFAPAAAAAYVTVLIHAAFDWDWEIPVIPIAALLLASVVLVSARNERRRFGLPVAAAGAATAVAAVAACAVAIGNGALAGASHASTAGDWPRAQALAVKAERWQPWSAEPLLVLGQAEAATGDARAARASFARAAALAPRDWRAWYDLAAASRGRARRAALLRMAALVR